MSDHHHHDHSHAADFSALNKAFYIGIALNLLFVFIEAFFGFYNNSLALLSDAGHNLSDVASLALSLFAFRLLRKKATQKYTYGFRRGTILASLINAVILIIAVGFIIYEATQRFFHPQPMEGGIVAMVALVGIFINGITAWLFMKDQKNDLNVKGAYLHMLADALVSAGVVIAGLIIMKTKWFWLDSVLSVVIGVVILVSTWSLLAQSLKLSMDGVPENISIPEIQQEILEHPAVQEVNHIHIWALSTTENALTAHIRLKSDSKISESEAVKAEITHLLAHQNIQHCTLETYFGEKLFSQEI